MKNLNTTAKLFIFFFLGILFCQFSSSNDPDISIQIRGKWKYDSHIYRNVGRYGPKEVDLIKSSLLCFTKDKVYFTDVTFIDTCFYSELHAKAFFDRESKESSYFLDGPLAIRYTEQKLSKFVRIELNCKPNGFGTFYLNTDTLILDTTGGITFFFTKSKSDN
jgi:hypothetical protein